MVFPARPCKLVRMQPERFLLACMLTSGMCDNISLALTLSVYSQELEPCYIIDGSGMLECSNENAYVAGRLRQHDSMHSGH